MAVLFVVGTMNLVWMGVLAIVIFVEKLVPYGVKVSKVTGLALIVFGLVVGGGGVPPEG
jgi:predicted metal-binding membrane protein